MQVGERRRRATELERRWPRRHYASGVIVFLGSAGGCGGKTHRRRRRQATGAGGAPGAPGAQRPAAKWVGAPAASPALRPRRNSAFRERRRPRRHYARGVIVFLGSASVTRTEGSYCSKNAAFFSMKSFHFSGTSDSDGKMASTGHSGSQAPQSMQIAGSIYN